MTTSCVHDMLVSKNQHVSGDGTSRADLNPIQFSLERVPGQFLPEPVAPTPLVLRGHRYDFLSRTRPISTSFLIVTRSMTTLSSVLDSLVSLRMGRWGAFKQTY